MSFTGDEIHDVPLTTASGWTKNYRDTLTSSSTPIAHYFGKTAISDLLDQTSCVGLRIYYAIDGDGKQQLVIVGVDSSGNDLYEGDLLDRSTMCPPSCSSANPLNTDTSAS